MTPTDPKPVRTPCKSCPYRRDVPSGLWDASEYAKLGLYDGETGEQSAALFFCHQRNGKLCAGWLGCHDPEHLLALRFHRVDDSAYSYVSPVPLFASGAEAAAHGMADIAAPKPPARRAIARLRRKIANAE